MEEIIERRGKPGLWCLIEPWMAGGEPSVERSL